MNKQELFALIKTKAIVDDNILEQEYQERKRDLLKKGVEENKVENYTLQALKTFYKKQFISPASKFEGIIIRDEGITDYGAKRKLEATKTRFNECSEQERNNMIRNSEVDKDGNPLWTTETFKKGSIINPEKEKQRKLTLLLKKENDEDYKVGFLTLKNSQLNIKRLMFESVIFRANIGKEENNMYYLNSSTVTEFIATNKNIDIVELIKKHFKENLVRNLSELAQHHEKNKLNMNRFVIVKANIANINLDASFSNIVSLDDDTLGIDKAITGFLNKDYEINFVEGALNAILFGKTITRKNRENVEELSLRVEGVFVDDMWKREFTPKVEPFKIEEETEW